MADEANQFMPTSVTLEEIGAMEAASTAAAAAPVVDEKLELQRKGLEEALRISEEARLRTQSMLDQAMAQTASKPAPQPDEPKEISDDELAQLYVTDPIKAIKVASDQAAKRTERNLVGRMGGLYEGASTMVEQRAREKYAVEFELFKDDIAEVIRTVPNAKQALSTTEAWDDLIRYVRGKDANLEKLIAHRTNGGRSAAQAGQAAGAGATLASGGAGIAGGSGSNYGLDAVQMEIADKTGMSYADYAKWAKVR